MDRRDFLKFGAGLAAAGLASAVPLRLVSALGGEIKAVLFDAFPVFDPRPVFVQAEAMAPGDGGAFLNLWRTKQFEYTWLRTAGVQYRDFWSVTRDALRYAARARKVELRTADEDRIMGAYLSLDAWPDVKPALQTLRDAGLRLGFLSNFTEEMLASNIRHAGLEGIFEQVLSTDRARVFKPHPAAYRLGIEALKLEREEIGFAAFAAWDVAGAKWFGYPTYWVNRSGQPAEELAEAPDAAGSDLSGLAAFAGRSHRGAARRGIR